MAESLAMRTVVEPASRSEADGLLRDWASRLVRAHVTTREDQDFAQSQKSMIEQTMREYGGRFLFELIQNGYDAQPPSAENGRIAIVLADDEGPHGIKSVLQICAAPEVYSTLPGGAPGFCFRFAGPDDVAELVGGDPVLARQVIDEV